MKRYGGDFWSGLALGALGAYIVFEASGWEYLGPDGPGPGFFPLWYGIAMAGLSLWLMVSSVLRAQTESIDWGGARRAFATWLALAAAVAALKLVGFLVAFAALVFFMVAVMYRRSPGRAAIVAACMTAGFYVVFPFALGVKLP